VVWRRSRPASSKNEPLRQQRSCARWVFPQPAKPEVERLSFEAPNTARIEPMQRSKAQDTAILSAIKAAGYEPKRLPNYTPGFPGVKAAIRQRVSTEHPDLFPANGKTFEKAWERLSGFKDVGYIED
jgi:hypothetical protein